MYLSCHYVDAILYVGVAFVDRFQKTFFKRRSVPGPLQHRYEAPSRPCLLQTIDAQVIWRSTTLLYFSRAIPITTPVCEADFVSFSYCGSSFKRHQCIQSRQAFYRQAMSSFKAKQRKWLREASMRRLSQIVKDKTELIDSAQKLRMNVATIEGLEESGLSKQSIQHLENWVEGM